MQFPQRLRQVAVTATRSRKRGTKMPGPGLDSEATVEAACQTRGLRVSEMTNFVSSNQMVSHVASNTSCLKRQASHDSEACTQSIFLNFTGVT
eukprot:3293614-Amphidinium_carterae.1